MLHEINDMADDALQGEKRDRIFYEGSAVATDELAA